jgi:excisionase family DNA binding protein
MAIHYQRIRSHFKRTSELNKKFYTIPEAAEICLVNRATMLRWVKAGRLKSFQTPGGHYRILMDDLEYFLRENNMPGINQKNSRKKILIVDDDPQIPKVVSRILAPYQHEMAVAHNGFEAGLKVKEFEPDLIILDLFMPMVDGFEVCKSIKKNPDMDHIRVLILTGHDTPETRKQVMEVGADAMMAKPIEKDVLLEHVNMLLQ